MSKVAVLETTPEDVVQDYGKLMESAGYQSALPKDRELLLKLNLSWSLYFPACSTQPWQLEGVLEEVTGEYPRIHPVENQTVVTDPVKGARLNKWMPILEKYDLPFTPLTDVEWTHYEPKAEMLAMHEIFPEGFRIPEMFKGKSVLHLPTQKTHGHTTITGAMKNAFGGLLTKRRHHSHRMIHEVLVDLLQIQKEIHPGIFAVMDGTVYGDGAGPRAMKPRVGNHILASQDQVAIDAISAKMMGYQPMDIDFIRLAHERGLGVGDPDQIEVVGKDIKNICYNCETAKSLVVWGDQLFRKGALKFLEPLLFHTPLFRLCILGSAVFHDHVWYPTVGRKRIREFNQTRWGRLFQTY